MALVMYTKYWQKMEFQNRRKRILIDPSFAISGMMIKAKDRGHENLARKYCKPLLTIPNDEIRLVFFPMLDWSAEKSDEHWWCLCIDMVKRQLWMIDSWYLDTHLKSMRSLLQNCFSYGVLVRSSFDTSYPLEKNLKKRLFLEDTNNSFNELRDNLMTSCPRNECGQKEQQDLLKILFRSVMVQILIWGELDRSLVHGCQVFVNIW